MVVLLLKLSIAADNEAVCKPKKLSVIKITDRQLFIHLVNYSLEQNITLIPSASSTRLTALMWIQEIGWAMPVSPTISYWTGHVFLVPLFCHHYFWKTFAFVFVWCLCQSFNQRFSCLNFSPKPCIVRQPCYINLYPLLLALYFCLFLDLHGNGSI